MEWFEVHASFILLLGSLQQLGDNLVHYVVDVSATLQCAHVMSERERGRERDIVVHVYTKILVDLPL